MNKTAIKNFSINARNKLVSDIEYKAGLLGITEDGIKDSLPQSTKETEFYDIGTKEPYQIVGSEIRQRRQLVSLIKKKMQELEYRQAFQNVVEEVAYTWFNRLIAIRFMEVNDYMPSHIRVLSSESGTKLEPDIVTAPFDAGLEFTCNEEQYILKLKNENAVDELFRFLFIRQCNALNVYLPKLFEKTADYTEFLLNVSVTDQDGVVYHLIHDIEEKDFNIREGGQVEIIGWMYQYYNSEPKDETFALLKKNVKITKERIPAATQLFTPDWIVRYMVENSLGRLWLEGHPDDSLKRGWKYYLEEAEQEADVAAQLEEIRKGYQDIKPEDIKFIDPCMGSGHILVYAFDVLMQIYESYGYSRRDAAKSIIENNIYGLDIDDRAFQLSYFAVMMKAREYNRRIFTQGIEPNLYAIQESNGLKMDIDMGDFLLSEEYRDTLRYLLDVFVDAKEYGSILEVEDRDYEGFMKAWELAAEQTAENVVMMLWYSELNEIVPTLAKQAGVLAGKYDVLVTNPPYMGLRSGNAKLNNYVKRFYPDSKSDLFAVFIEKCGNMIGDNCYQAMITQHAWMFLSSYEKLRAKLQMKNITNVVHLGARAFEEIGGEVVQTVSFVMSKKHIAEYKGTYCRLIEPITQNGKEEMYLAERNRYTAVQENFAKIPGSPIAYWINSNWFKTYASNPILREYIVMKKGTSTGDNVRFIRQWQEVNIEKIFFNAHSPEEAEYSGKKWFPINGGGERRKWYGNRYDVVNWESDGVEMKREATRLNHGGHWSRYIINPDKFFNECIGWSAISSSKISVRYVGYGFAFSSAAMEAFEKEIIYIMALINSVVAEDILKLLAPTLNFGVEQVGKIPIKIANKTEVENITNDNIRLSKLDWDSFETSWDFMQHPLIRCAAFSMREKDADRRKYIEDMNYIEDAFLNWENECLVRFEQLRLNEEKLNRIFIDIYDLQNELTPKVEDKDITVHKADMSRDIRSFIAYSVGCMFGRYSFNKEGLLFAGGSLKDVYSYYEDVRTSFYYLPMDGKMPLECWNIDPDNIIPITDEGYFADDIVNRLVEFVKMVYGEKTLEENLDFIARSLDSKGNSSREVIRNYFLKGFFSDHLKVYQKRPIYWLFDSGKQNGFKALIYMHRYNADTIGNLRVDYLHTIERIYESEIKRMQDTIDNSTVAREITVAAKRMEKLKKQLKECQEYDEKIGHLALSRIEIDLDDGVKVNYEKIQTAKDGKKYQVLAKI